MHKDRVFKIDTCSKFADITLIHKSGSITTIYKVVLPENRVFKSNKNGKLKPVLVPGNTVNTLRDNGQDIAYLYNGHAFLVNAPKNCHDFVKKLPLSDKIEFAHALRLELLRNRKIPSIMTYKNLQRIAAKCGLVR